MWWWGGDKKAPAPKAASNVIETNIGKMKVSYVKIVNKAERIEKDVYANFGVVGKDVYAFNRKANAIKKYTIDGETLKMANEKVMEAKNPLLQVTYNDQFVILRNNRAYISKRGEDKFVALPNGYTALVNGTNKLAMPVNPKGFKVAELSPEGKVINEKPYKGLIEPSGDAAKQDAFAKFCANWNAVDKDGMYVAVIRTLPHSATGKPAPANNIYALSRDPEKVMYTIGYDGKNPSKNWYDNVVSGMKLATTDKYLITLYNDKRIAIYDKKTGKQLEFSEELNKSFQGLSIHKICSGDGSSFYAIADTLGKDGKTPEGDQFLLNITLK